MARSLHTAAHRELVAAVIAMRTEAGLTQRALAERLGREHNFVARLETGQRRIDLVEWVMLCKACERDAVAEVNRVLPRLVPLVTSRSRGAGGKKK